LTPVKIMANSKQNKKHGRTVLLFVGLVALTAFGWLHAGLAQQDARSRRVAPVQSPTPPRNGNPTPTPATTGSPTDDGVEVNPEDVIKIDSNLVNVNVRVVDRNNRPISDVQKNEFTLYEDGVQQDIQFFTKEEVPISYGIAVDNSGSMRSQITTVIDASKNIVGSNRPGDETFVVRFTGRDNIELLQDFTSNKQELVDTLDEKILIEPGQTAIIDAVYLSVERLGQSRDRSNPDDKRRHALILVTDGEDRDSYHKESDLFELLRENDVQIYIIGFVDELGTQGGLIKKSPQEKAVALLNDLAKQTGGRVFFPKSLDELPGIANEITRDLRTQYVLSYAPTKVDDGSFRSLRVTVADAPGRDKRIALTRSGRNASTQPTGPAPRATPKPVPPKAAPTPRRVN
jgi:Ca-activated chloride channel family protein